MTEQLFAQDAYLNSCEAIVIAVDENGIQLDRTVFYAMGGGQPGDSGVLRLTDGREVKIVDTRKGDNGAIFHLPAEDAALPQPGEPVIEAIDWERRYRHMKLHTCLHLLCAVVAAPVTGGAIGADRARLDFDVPDPTLDKQRIMDALNRLIEEHHPVRTLWISDAELDAQPELVKTMAVQPPRGQGKVRLLEVEGVDLQPCGGTHVVNTGEIGRVVVTKIEKKSRLNRRVIVAFQD